MIANNWSYDLTLCQGWTIMNGCDADLIIGIFDDDREKSAALGDYLCHTLNNLHIIAAERQGINTLICQHNELHQVDGIRSFTQDPALWTR